MQNCGWRILQEIIVQINRERKSDRGRSDSEEAKGKRKRRKREPNTEEKLSCYWIISGDTQNINIVFKLGIFYVIIIFFFFSFYLLFFQCHQKKYAVYIILPIV